MPQTVTDTDDDEIEIIGIRFKTPEIQFLSGPPPGWNERPRRTRAPDRRRRGTVQEANKSLTVTFESDFPLSVPPPVGMKYECRIQRTAEYLLQLPAAVEQGQPFANASAAKQFVVVKVKTLKRNIADEENWPRGESCVICMDAEEETTVFLTCCCTNATYHVICLKQYRAHRNIAGLLECPICKRLGKPLAFAWVLGLDEAQRAERGRKKNKEKKFRKKELRKPDEDDPNEDDSNGDGNTETIRHRIPPPPIQIPPPHDASPALGFVHPATPRPTLLFAIASDDPEAVRRVLEARSWGGPRNRYGRSCWGECAAVHAREQAALQAFGNCAGVASVWCARPRDAVSIMCGGPALIHRSFFRPLTRMRYELVGQDRALEQLFPVLSIHSQQLTVLPVVVLLCGPSRHGKSLTQHGAQISGYIRVLLTPTANILIPQVAQMGSSKDSKKKKSEEAVPKKTKTAKKPADSEKPTDKRPDSKRKRTDPEDGLSGKENEEAEARPKRKKISTLETMQRVSQSITQNPTRSKARPMPEEEEINAQAPPQNKKKKHVPPANVREDSPLGNAPLPSKKPAAPAKVQQGNFTLRLGVGATMRPTAMPTVQLPAQTVQTGSPPGVQSIPKPRPVNKGAKNAQDTNMDVDPEPNNAQNVRLDHGLSQDNELSDTEPPPVPPRNNGKAKARHTILSDDEEDYDSGVTEEGEPPEESQRRKGGTTNFHAGGGSSNNNDFDDLDNGADFDNGNNAHQGNQVVQSYQDLFEDAQQNLLNKQRQEQEKVRTKYFQNFQPPKNISHDVDYRQQGAEDKRRWQQEDEKRREQVEENKRRRREEEIEEQRSKDQRRPVDYASDDRGDADQNVPDTEDQDDGEGEEETQGNMGPKDGLKSRNKAQIEPLSLKTDNRQQLAEGAQLVLDKHHSKNKPALPPSGKHLQDCRQQQQQVMRTPTDSEEDDDEDSGGENSNQEDSDEESDSGDSGKKKRKTRSRNAGEPSPTQEAFYPRPWKKVLAAIKPAIAKYLLIVHFFPDQEVFLRIIEQYIEEAIYLYEQQVDALDRYYFKHHEEDMMKLLWGFLSTFRGRCKDIAKEVVIRWFTKRIYPDEDEFGESFSQDKYVEKTMENVKTLLHRGQFLEDGLDEQAIFILKRFLFAVLTMGSRPLFKEFEDELLPPVGEYYHPNIVAAMTVLLRSAIEEYSSGTPVNIPFKHKTYLPVYARALENMFDLQKNTYHFIKTTGRWIEWVKRTRAKRVGLQQTWIAGEDVMALTLD
ncbi:hypothetical protein C8R45DRAFT_1178797 [Mycena sanguinolenta]|nr:hypothetical protein C8R45DRAFT_1178797 [Mycena sanguinolenta]